MTARFRLPAGRTYNVRASEQARDRQHTENAQLCFLTAGELSRTEDLVWTVMTARFRLPAGRTYNVRASEQARDRQHTEVLCNVLLLDNSVQAFKVNLHINFHQASPQHLTGFFHHCTDSGNANKITKGNRSVGIPCRSPSKPLSRKLMSGMDWDTVSRNSLSDERLETQSLPTRSPPGTPNHRNSMFAQEGTRLRPSSVGHLVGHLIHTSPSQVFANHKSPSSTQANSISLDSSSP
ncbi:UNVERIFIED_CONTAM: hypothetical protein FKN15_002151 [Acipenser sinensis]